jgi:hypothetical protein
VGIAQYAKQKMDNTLSAFLKAKSLNVVKKIFEEEEQVLGTPDDVTLDPAFDKEFFHSSFSEGDTHVTFKTLGAGQGSPVNVYLNDVRWEMFTGPKKAMKETKKFISSKQFESWKEKKGLIKKEEAPPSEKPSPSKQEEE